MSAFGSQLAGSGPAVNGTVLVRALARGACSQSLLMILAVCARLRSAHHALLKLVVRRAGRPSGLGVRITSIAGTAPSRESRIVLGRVSQLFAFAGFAIQLAISQAVAFLWLLVVVGGCLGLLGVVFSTPSAQPNAATVDLYHPVTTVRPGKTIRYDRSPRKPGAFAIAIGMAVAVVILALIWAQLTFMGGHTVAAVPPGASGRASACRRKDADEADGPDPMSVGGASDELIAMAQQWWFEAATKAGIDLTGFDPHAPLAERIAWAIQAGLEIAVVLSRFSSKLQHSTKAQV